MIRLFGGASTNTYAMASTNNESNESLNPLASLGLPEPKTPIESLTANGGNHDHHLFSVILSRPQSLHRNVATAVKTKELTSIGSVEDVYTGGAPLHFPPKNDENKIPIDGDGDDESSQMTFVQTCLLAAESHRPLHLSQDITDLSETIVLRKRQHLSIVGCISSSSSQKRTQIAGKLHSLFLLNNHSQLELFGLELIHQENDGDDCRNVGAAVNIRYKSRARLEQCSVISHSGFCCWAVQKAGIVLEGCYLEAPLRSAVVCFGQAKFEGRSSTVSNVGVHGVCARGECSILLVDFEIVNAAVRGLYAYANASVSMEGCTVTGTVRRDMAAIEVLSSEMSGVETGINPKQLNGKTHKKKKPAVVAAPKASSLCMTSCKVIDNSGVGVRIRGGVRHNLHSNDTSNHFARNSGGDQVDFCSASQEDQKSKGSEGKKKNTNGNISSEHHFQRDASGSSFRRGDWWCRICVPKCIVHGSKKSCPRCSSGKGDGELLTSEEVIKLNRGDESIKAAGAQRWWFDGDDSGWLPYDDESNEKLESAFQSLRYRSPKEGEEKEHDQRQASGNVVFLSKGRYRVNLETMEQVNTDSHFLRLVQRREN